MYETPGGVKEIGYMNRFDKKNPEIYLRWYDDFTGEDLNILFMSRKEAKRVAETILKTIDEMDNHEEKIRKIISETNFTKLYNEFERKYNKYPVQMGRYEAFGRALGDHLIDKDTYEAAERYYGNLWNYVGD